jgi:hypothetical protein
MEITMATPGIIEEADDLIVVVDREGLVSRGSRGVMLVKLPSLNKKPCEVPPRMST